jgi:hypothetical protein
MATPLPKVTSTNVLRQLLRQAGWRDATGTDTYARAAGLVVWEPVRPKRATGHSPAQLRWADDVVGLSTYSRDGSELEAVSWAWVDPLNLHRVHDYVTQALADAIELRGER